MLKKGIYSATLSIINKDNSLNVEETIKHAESTIKQGLHGVFFFGSTGQSQLISTQDKKELISTIASHKLKKQFYLGTGCNSFKENSELISYAVEYGFNYFLVMPPAYYKGNTEKGVYNFYEGLIKENPKAKLILYNFEKLSGFKFSVEFVKKLVDAFPKNIVGCKDSTYNLFEVLKLPNFLMFPGSESKLLKGLELGCAGCITATANVTHSLARKVFDDFENKKDQTTNSHLIAVREAFENFNLITAVHTFLGEINDKYKNVLPPLTLLNQEDKIKLLDKLKSLKFLFNTNIAA